MTCATPSGAGCAKVGGLALILLAVLATVALATWSVQDPSLSHATNAPVRNLLGVPGAIAADLLMQLFGLAAVALVLPVAIWGWRLMTHRPLERERLRIALWICGAVVGAGFAACLPRGLSWPLPTGLGGVIGDALLRVPGVLTGSVSGKTAFVMAVVFGVMALVAIVGASGFGWNTPSTTDERAIKTMAGPVDDDEERTSISLGWLVHGLLSLKARLMRLAARTFSPRPEMLRPAPAAPSSRREPASMTAGPRRLPPPRLNTTARKRPTNRSPPRANRPARRVAPGAAAPAATCCRRSICSQRPRRPTARRRAKP